jgi:hypothetical protein
LKNSATFRILCSGQWSPEQITAYDSTQPHVLPEPHAERAQTYWQELTARGDKYLFNGELFRLENFAATDHGLSLHLGRTCYRDQIYSNAHAAELSKNFGEKSVARGLGVSALVITADADLLIIRRGEHLGEEPGKLDVVGGHAHPDQHFTRGVPDLFRAILEELETELNLPAVEVLTNICCGLVENVHIRKPDLAFLAHTRLARRDIAGTMAAAAEADEIAELLAVPAVPAAVGAFLETYETALTPSACACLHLLAKM